MDHHLPIIPHCIRDYSASMCGIKGPEVLTMKNLTKVLVPAVVAAIVVVLGTAPASWAGVSVPEIEPSSGIAALALVSGVVLLVRARVKK